MPQTLVLEAIPVASVRTGLLTGVSRANASVPFLQNGPGPTSTGWALARCRPPNVAAT